MDIVMSRDVGGVEILAGLLNEGQEQSPQLVGAVLQALHALAGEQAAQLEFIRTNALPAVVKIISTSDDEVCISLTPCPSLFCFLIHVK